MIKPVRSHLKKCLGVFRILRIRFCVFWGIRCRLPISRANDDLTFIEASNRGHRKAVRNQLRLIRLMMLPIWLILIFWPDKRVVVALWYLLPCLLVGVIGVAVGELTVVSGSPGIQTRRELVRLRALEPLKATAGVALPKLFQRSDVSSRMRQRLEDMPWNVPEFRKKQFGRP